MCLEVEAIKVSPMTVETAATLNPRLQGFQSPRPAERARSSRSNLLRGALGLGVDPVESYLTGKLWQ